MTVMLVALTVYTIISIMNYYLRFIDYYAGKIFTSIRKTSLSLRVLRWTGFRMKGQGFQLTNFRIQIFRFAPSFRSILGSNQNWKRTLLVSNQPFKLFSFYIETIANIEPTFSEKKSAFLYNLGCNRKRRWRLAMIC